MKAVAKKDDVLALQESDDEKAIREARSMERADLETLLNGNPNLKEMMRIMQRCLIRLLALEKDIRKS